MTKKQKKELIWLLNYAKGIVNMSEGEEKAILEYYLLGVTEAYNIIIAGN